MVAGRWAETGRRRVGYFTASMTTGCFGVPSAPPSLVPDFAIARTTFTPAASIVPNTV